MASTPVDSLTTALSAVSLENPLVVAAKNSNFWQTITYLTTHLEHLIALLPEELRTLVQKKHHVTLLALFQLPAFLAHLSSPTTDAAMVRKKDILSSLLTMEGTVVTWRLLSLVYLTEEGIATIKVELVTPADVPVENTHAHITFALKEGVPAVNSNPLLAHALRMEGVAADPTNPYHATTPVVVDLRTYDMTVTGPITGNPRPAPKGAANGGAKGGSKGAANGGAGASADASAEAPAAVAAVAASSGGGAKGKGKGPKGPKGGDASETVAASAPA